MNSQARIESVRSAKNLGSEVTGIPSFCLSDLNLPKKIDFDLPQNLRLGHLVEKVVSHCIHASANYKVLHENTQVIVNKTTIGELDFILENTESQKQIHLELAYKFYLYDPNISAKPLHNWIGPNRNDSLIEKLEKLKTKQFPLLHHPAAKSALSNTDVNQTEQALCFLVALYIPYQYKQKINPEYAHAVKGHYFSFETFENLHKDEKQYFIPAKSQWGVEPSSNKTWYNLSALKSEVKESLNQKRAVMCWQKENHHYSAFFIVWW